jgi:hypothetical protein
MLNGSADAREAAAVARAVRGVESAEVTPATANLIIYHDPPTVSAEALLDVLHARGCLTSPARSGRRRRVDPLTALVPVLVRAVVTGLAQS